MTFFHPKGQTDTGVEGWSHWFTGRSLRRRRGIEVKWGVSEEEVGVSMCSKVVALVGVNCTFW